MSLRFEEPDGQADWKPTWYMEQMSRHLEDFPDGLSLRVWLSGVGGGRKLKEQAISQLIADKYVRMEREGTAHIHTVVKPYRDPADTESNQL